ncbi:zinc finger protein weckle isoform X1 [Drosophila subobscura]|uniref:zinc finger protein weckle isoform X1 n=1 Tax=Drosophila subobscura TaxID=7241 RepID=UPI00155A10F6|nr:zinc finger protein weckle isoform X1 [Drosophila subobscura]
MGDYATEHAFRKQWLYWCRLCAKNDAEIKVRDNSDDEEVVRIISKCFDVEMTLEEPELGSMLCNECFSMVGQLISFSENVNKVQAIFELLRHTETTETLNVFELRRQYGLSVDYKTECEDYGEDGTEEFLGAESPVCEMPDEKLPIEALIDTDNEHPSVSLVKRRRGRPKGSSSAKKPNNTNTPTQLAKVAAHIEPKRFIKVEPSEDSPLPDYESCDTQPEEQQEMENNSPPAAGSHTCKICQKTLISAASLRRHKLEVHCNLKRFICDVCGKGLTTFTALVEHKLVHTDYCPCICHVCNAAFKNKARLRVHLQTHGAPSFECNVCGKKLQTRAILNKHKYVHTDERRFKCDICGLGSKNSTAMKIHLLSHTGLRPYVCKYCGKAFASNTNCRAHKFKKHPYEASMEDEKESSRIPVPTLDELRAITREMAKSKKEAEEAEEAAEAAAEELELVSD